MERERQNQPSPQEVRLERKGNVVHIYKPEGIYTIIYGSHIVSQNPSELPERLDGLFLESINDYVKEPLKTLYSSKEVIQYKSLLGAIEKKRIPLYFADVSFERWFVIWLAEPAWNAGGCVLLILAEEPALKAIGGILLVPFLANLARDAARAISLLEAPTAKLNKVAKKIPSPANFYLLNLREAISAHKMEWAAKHLGLTKTHLTSIWGADHIGIEDWVQRSPEDRIRFLGRWRPLWEPLIAPKTIYSLARLDFDGQNWQIGEIFEVPELKELVT